MAFAKKMHLSKLITAILFLLTSCLYAEYHLTENVVFDIAHAAKKLPKNKDSLLLLAKESEERSINLAGGLVVKVSWAQPKDSCKIVNSLGRLQLNEYKSQKEAALKQLFFKKDKTISSSNAERLGDKYTLILYHFKEKDKDGVFNIVIVDIFGDSIVTNIKFGWKDTIQSSHALTVSGIVDSIKVIQNK